MLSGAGATLCARLERPDGARLVVVAILTYVAAITLIRLTASAYLEIDEAQFVGHVDLRLVYGNSHPPLYNWLVRGALEITGWRWALALALLRATLLAATLIMLFDTALRLGGPLTGALAVACALLCPQVSWMSAHTLAHSLLVMTAAAGVLHGLALTMTRPAPGGLILMGLWAGVGILAKYNIALLIAPLAVAMVAEPTVRAIIGRRRVELATAALVFAAFAGAAAAGVWQAPAASTERISKLYRDGPFSFMDVPLLGIDGVAALALAVLAWGAVPLLIWVLARRAGTVAPAAARVLRHTIVVGLAGFAALILVADASAVHERYLTPLLMALPVLAALAAVNVAWRAWVLAAGIVAMIAVPVGIIGMVGFDTHRYARPYEALAAPIAAVAPAGAIAVRSTSPDLAANMTLALQHLRRAAAVDGDARATAAAVIVQVEPGGWPVPDHASQVWCVRDNLDIAAPYTNWTGRTMAITAVIYATCPASPG